MKPFTPAKVKGDILFIASLVAVFGFSIPTGISVALIGAAGLIAAVLNYGDMVVEKADPKLMQQILGYLKTAESDGTKVLSAITPILDALPGKIGQEVKQAIEAVEKDKAAASTDTPAAKG